MKRNGVEPDAFPGLDADLAGGGDDCAGATKRVCIATPAIAASDGNEELGAACRHLACLLAGQGHEVVIAHVGGAPADARLAGEVRERGAGSGIACEPLPVPRSALATARTRMSAPAWTLFDWLRGYEPPFDVVHVPDWHGVGYGALLAKSLGLAFGATHFVVHGHAPVLWSAEGGRRFLTTKEALGWVFMERRSAELADTLVCRSVHLLQWMREAGYALPARSFVWPGPFPAPARSPEAVAARAERDGAKLEEVVFFGRLTPRQGLDLFIRAIDRLARRGRAPGRIVFLDRRPGRGDAPGLVRGAAQRWSVEVRTITGLGFEEAVAHLSRPGRLAVMTSSLENSSMAVMACLREGIPFVATATGGTPELVAPACRARVLVAPDHVALGERIAELAGAPLRATLPRWGFDRAREVWSRWHAQAAPFEAAAGHFAGKARAAGSETPLVTVCVVHHERPELVRMAVDSVRAQDYPALETVLVDDGSESAAAQAALDAIEADFGTRGWRVIRQENRWLGAARNAAAAAAQGEWLLFLDDDDVLFPDAVSRLVRAARFSGADCVPAARVHFSGDGDPRTGTPPRGSPVRFLGAARGWCRFANVAGGACALVRRAAFEAVGGFTEDYGVALEDLEFFNRLDQAGFRVEPLPDPLYYYRQQPTGMSGQLSDPHSAEASRVRVSSSYVAGLPGEERAFALYAGFREEAIGGLREQVRAREEAIGGLREQVRAREEAIGGLREQVRAREEAIGGLREQVRAREEAIGELHASIAWRMSAPLRVLSVRIGRLRRSFRLLFWLGAGKPSRTHVGPGAGYLLLHLRLVLLAEKSWRYLKYLHIREGLLIAREVRSVLSIGCGKAYAELMLAVEFPDLRFHATDRDEARYRVARDLARKWRVTNITFGKYDVLSSPTETYDLVLAVEVLEYIQDDRKAALHVLKASRKYVFCLAPFVDESLSENHDRKERMAARLRRCRAGYSPGDLKELFPEIAVVRGCYWSGAGQEFKSKLGSLSSHAIEKDAVNLWVEARRDVRDAYPEDLRDCQGMWVLAGPDPSGKPSLEQVPVPKGTPGNVNRRHVKKAEALFWGGTTSDALVLWRALLARFPNDEALAGRARFAISILERLSDVEGYKRRIDAYRNSRASRLLEQGREPRIAVYTAIAGGYDSVALPQFLDSRYDYVLFTDCPVPDTGVWQVRPMTYINADGARSARFVKTHPHRFLRDFDIAVWMDSNVMILKDFHHLVEHFLSSGTAVAAVPHPLRKSVYEECDACTSRGKDDPRVVREQEDKYRKEGYVHDDLLESGFMIFDMRNGKTADFLDLWWREIDCHSKRDQLSANYALSRSGLDWHRLMERPENIRSHPSFAFVRHDKGKGYGTKLIDALKTATVDPYDGACYAQVKDSRTSRQKDRNIDVVVCVHNALEHVEQCLSSVVRNRGSAHQNLILIDDGSDDPTRDYLKAFAASVSWCRLYRNERAVGYPKAANRGMAASTGELVVLLNSDTIVTKGWLEKFADAVFSTSGAGIVGPMSNAASYQSVPEYRGRGNQTAINTLPPGLGPEDMNRCCERWTSAHVLPRVPLVHGFCFGITRGVMDRIGLFDVESFPEGYGEESDYCFRASDAGFDLVVATHTYIFHEKSKSYSDEKRIPLMKAASETFRRKFGQERIRRATRSMAENPFFVDFRARTQRLMEEKGRA